VPFSRSHKEKIFVVFLILQARGFQFRQDDGQSLDAGDVDGKDVPVDR
jgi:hypothetical protein